MAFTAAQNTDARNSIFNDAGRDINIYQIANPTDIPKLVADKDSTITYKLMPCGNPLFTGRSGYLKKLRQYFAPRDDSRPRRLFLLHGMGGVGKTQISLKFVEDNSAWFWRTFWVDASSAETTELSLQDIASDRDARTSGVEHSTKSVLQWLSVIDYEWLIVFDNADGNPHMLSKYIPAGNRGNILFTSRNQGVSRYVSREAFVEVDHMDEEDAISLLLNSA